MKAQTAQTKPFALCIDIADYQASLVLGKIYRIVSDPQAANDDLVRVVDESGEGYLFQKSHFCVCGFSGECAEKTSSLVEVT